MLPNTKEIAYQIAVLHGMDSKQTISQIANRLMVSPIFVINALDEGEKLGLFNRVKGEDTLINVQELDYNSFLGQELGSESYRIQNEIMRVIASANADQDDVEHGTLTLWCRGIKESEVEMAIHLLEMCGIIVSYQLADPGDKKSKYTFYSLAVNDGQLWGKKQFTKPVKKKKSK